MSDEIKFDGIHYEEVKRYLNSHRDLHLGSPFGTDGRLYLTNSKKPSGFLLQKCCSNSNEFRVSVMNYHPSFDQIKEDLEKIVKK